MTVEKNLRAARKSHRGRLYLRKKGAELQIVALADQEGMTCVEVPVLLSPDDDPYFEEASWRDRVTKSKSQSRKR